MQKYHKYLYLFCKLIKTKGRYYKFLNCRRNHGNKSRVNAAKKRKKGLGYAEVVQWSEAKNVNSLMHCHSPQGCPGFLRAAGVCRWIPWWNIFDVQEGERLWSSQSVSANNCKRLIYLGKNRFQNVEESPKFSLVACIAKTWTILAQSRKRVLLNNLDYHVIQTLRWLTQKIPTLWEGKYNWGWIVGMKNFLHAADLYFEQLEKT